LVPTPSNDSPPSSQDVEPAWTIDGGLDQDWPEGVHDAVESLRQGDLVESPPFFYYADGGYPVFSLTRDWAAATGSAPGAVSAADVAFRPPYGVITTHTCDLVEEARPGKPRQPRRPWVQVSPVYFRRCETPGEARAIREGRRFDYLVWMSTLGEQDHGVWVADLRISVPVEKGWFVDRTHRFGFSDGDHAAGLASRIAKLATRPAYPLTLNDRVLRPLDDRLQQLCDEFPAADGIDEVSLDLGYQRDDPEYVQIVFIGEQTIPAEVQEALMTWWATTFADDQPVGLVILEPEFATYDTVDVRRYKRLVPFDISRLSPPE
jgi:hypothetical protein